MRLDLARNEPVPFPVVERLREQGATDYLAQIVGFGVDGERSGETGVVASWTTRDRRASPSATSRSSSI